MFFRLSTEGLLVNKRDLLAIYHSGTYCHKTGTRPPSCVTPRQPTKDAMEFTLTFTKIKDRGRDKDEKTNF